MKGVLRNLNITEILITKTFFTIIIYGGIVSLIIILIVIFAIFFKELKNKEIW